MKKKFVILSGAGVSAESGLKTFRDSDGLWEGYDIMEVATPQAWQKDYKTVLKFYNERRSAVKNAAPNNAHLLIAGLEKHFDVLVITQNIDDLHERAGSSNVMHLHGEILKSRSTKDESLIYHVAGNEIKSGDFCELGSQLRPHIVWFGEAVPMMEAAMHETRSADYFLVIGTSLVVYPAASLVGFVPRSAKKFLIDPKANELQAGNDFTIFSEKAGAGMEKLISLLL